MYKRKCKECGVVFESYRNSAQFCSITCDDVYNRKLNELYESNNAKFTALVDPVPFSNYAVDFQMHRLKPQFVRYAEDYGSFEYCPDFQRGHVWTRDKQIAFIEAIAKNSIPKSLLTITLNCPDFEDDRVKGDLSGFCIIDGLQRVTAVQEFVEGKFKVFGGTIGYDDFDYSSFSYKRIAIRVQVFTFKWKKDLLKYYIAINSGGVVHADEEIDRVKKLLQDCDKQNN